MAPLTLALEVPATSLESCGGKGLNLVRLTRAGFRVPPGFIIATGAYRSFFDANDLRPLVVTAVADLDPADGAALEAASTTIRQAFTEGRIPAEILTAIRSAATDWLETPLAVRSSATAEDLPHLSFAGQHDTYLNVIGIDALLRAVVDCWSSLWTARALGYRVRNAIARDDVALAVVVQKLVPAEVSGVMFTANPLTGMRGETVIDATVGLGEALVSGQVEPDHFVVTRDETIIERTLGAKALATVSRSGGGVQTKETEAANRLALSDGQVRELAALGQAVQAEYNAPQDIEWALADGELHVLQSRTITSLYPLPDSGDERALWFSVGAFQGMLQPFTPLGQDTIRLMASRVGQIFGRTVNPRETPFLSAAGERLWVRIDGPLRSALGARVIPLIMGLAEPATAQLLGTLTQDPRWSPTSSRPSLAMVRSLLHLGRLVVPRLALSLVNPVRRRHLLEVDMAALVHAAEERERRASAAPDARTRLAARLEAFSATMGSALATAVPSFAPIMVPCMVMLKLLTKLATRAGNDGHALALEALRALPGNVTTDMDLALWDVATTVQRDPASNGLFLEGDAQDLVNRYTAGRLPPAAQEAISTFLQRYGMRGVAEIDLGQPRWRENPTPVMRTLQSYTHIADPSMAPDAVFAAGEAASAEATASLVKLLGSARPGWVPAALHPAGLRARFMIGRLRGMFGARETPKFTVVRMMGVVRRGLLDSAEELVRAGVLARAEDIMFLHLEELERLWVEPAAHWQTIVAQRREAYEREFRRRQVPRLLVGDGRTFYEGLGNAEDGAIIGSPVSPGLAEGLAKVVFDPQATHLEPGEILVCPGTDPAWTPLFLAAGGLVTEVGGMMTHGSVVAREYGIPAVVGVHKATQRLVTGQRIRLDGTAGTIEILDGSSKADAAHAVPAAD